MHVPVSRPWRPMKVVAQVRFVGRITSTMVQITENPVVTTDNIPHSQGLRFLRSARRTLIKTMSSHPMIDKTIVT